ncbi:cyclopropane fatty-acyl-phospholipid synthase-like methyltransferase [Novosphingobium fluoreni]|uniref:Cyclopropane fatty-acyl-phospholipid synthase-like methyltransferase n=1 Tax=Novosphingobium fluoreni TaxID=1391222 RepID=A0A7W6BWP1_9SPHN|nr:DUF938 domain-containing protein [Novosphingobium fluoreni]MBB3939349.1 cyclopropane fatty-acyl-phospholipid synthase-like methyltransferase [Novosphingobium fluoreni]
MSDFRLSSPAVARNRDPILAILRHVLPERGEVLEIASGTGEHVAYFAAQLPGLNWQPTDPSDDALASITAWRDAGGWPNLLVPLRLDAEEDVWPVDRAAAIVCINMIHISPWEATQGLMRGAERLLPSGAPMVLYGPYHQAGVPLAPSNAAFDASLKARDPRWGLRDLETVLALARTHGLRCEEVTAMPANNLTVVLRRD